MLLEFAVSNYRSIQTRQSLSLFTSGQVSPKELSENTFTLYSKGGGKTLLRSAVIYGANAAGKSNLLKALNALDYMVNHSNDFKLDDSISLYDPYKLDIKNKTAPVVFEIDFIATDGKRYYYTVVYNRKKIIEEELWVYPTDRKVSRKALLFTRKEGNQIEFGELYKGKKDFSPNPNQLLLSKPGVDEVLALQAAYRFFSSGLFCAIPQNTLFDEALLKMLEENLSANSGNTIFQEMIGSLARAADTGIVDIFIKDNEVSTLNLPPEMPESEREKIKSKYGKRIKTVHAIYENGLETGSEVFDLSEESSGTLKFMGLAGIIIDALQKGSVVIVDELDKNLHPLLTRMLIQLFHSTETNPNNAQIVFSSHDISLIDRDLFRRDQIIFIDKNIEGASEITRLSNFTGISKMVSLQKWYMNGMFRGIPAINSYQIDLDIKSLKPEHA
ncbi:MAG: ATP-binding protein [Bacteroidota bacterium]